MGRRVHDKARLLGQFVGLHKQVGAHRLVPGLADPQLDALVGHALARRLQAQMQAHRGLGLGTAGLLAQQLAGVVAGPAHGGNVAGGGVAQQFLHRRDAQRPLAAGHHQPEVVPQHQHLLALLHRALHQHQRLAAGLGKNGVAPLLVRAAVGVKGTDLRIDLQVVRAHAVVVGILEQGGDVLCQGGGGDGHGKCRQRVDKNALHGVLKSI